MEDWFGKPISMEGIKSTSMVYEAIDEIKKDPYACFCDEDQFSCHLELYPCPDGSLCICAGVIMLAATDFALEATAMIPTTSKLRSRTSGGRHKCHQLYVEYLRPKATPDKHYMCMRPCTKDALPVMSEIPCNKGAVSAGHNCWGILWRLSAERLWQSSFLALTIQNVLDLSALPSHASSTAKIGEERLWGSSPVGEQW